MNKIKHPLVKILRKAGYSTKRAMSLTISIITNYKQQRDWSSTDRLHLIYELAPAKNISGMFVWHSTPQGHGLWWNVANKLNQHS